jgi:hypothetical protein
MTLKNEVLEHTYKLAMDWLENFIVILKILNLLNIHSCNTLSCVIGYCSK